MAVQLGSNANGPALTFEHIEPAGDPLVSLPGVHVIASGAWAGQSVSWCHLSPLPLVPAMVHPHGLFLLLGAWGPAIPKVSHPAVSCTCWQVGWRLTTFIQPVQWAATGAPWWRRYQCKCNRDVRTAFTPGPPLPLPLGLASMSPRLLSTALAGFVFSVGWGLICVHDCGGRRLGPLGWHSHLTAAAISI